MSDFPLPEDRPERPKLEPERIVAALVLAAICVISLANVMVRYLTNISFAATEEISIALMVVLAFIGSASAFARNRHIAVTFLVERLPPALARGARLVAGLATLAMFALLVFYGGQLAYDEYRFEVTTPSMGWPQWLYTIWLPVLSAYIIVRILVRFADRPRP